MRSAIFEKEPRFKEASDAGFRQFSRKRGANIARVESIYFFDFFQRKVGVTFREWLSGIRVRKAVELMKEGDSTLPEIASAAGFNDLKTLQRTFKKHTGQTPQDYLRSLKLEKEQEQKIR